MLDDIRNRLTIKKNRLDEINNFLLDPNNELINKFISVVNKYGGPDEINHKAQEAGKVENLISKLRKKNLSYVKDLEWLIEQRDKGVFITVDEYRKKILGDKAKNFRFNEDFAVTLEISSCQYFPAFIKQVRQAIENQELMPGRFIRVRCMKEQEEDGDLLAINAAMQIIGASWCETLDTKGTDGSNIHLAANDIQRIFRGSIGRRKAWNAKQLIEYTAALLIHWQ